MATAGFRNDFLSKKIQEIYETNAKFAEALRKKGVEKGEDAVKKWRQGNSVPKVGELVVIAQALGIEVQELFDEPIFSDVNKTIKQISAPFADINKMFSELSEKITASFKGLNLNQEQDSNFGELIEKDIKKNNNDINIDIICIPKLSITASAGGGNNLETIDSFSVNGVFVGDNETLMLGNTKNLKAIKVDGYSMLPMLLPDSWVIFNDDGNFRGDGLYVLNWDNTLMIKIVQLAPDGKVEIISANKDYKSYTVDLSDSQIAFKIVGKVVKKIV